MESETKHEKFIKEIDKAKNIATKWMIFYAIGMVLSFIFLDFDFFVIVVTPSFTFFCGGFMLSNSLEKAFSAVEELKP